MSADPGDTVLTRHEPAVGNRWQAGIILLGVVVVLGLSAVLTPSADGIGTHEQLLMLPCGFHWLTGLPCPACGMTTAFAEMSRGQVMAAFRAHVLGPVAWALTWVMGLRALWALLTGVRVIPEWLHDRWLRATWVPRAVLWVVGLAWLANIGIRLLG